MSQGNTFHIGLCMAGSISAGAYTAGVNEPIEFVKDLMLNMRIKDYGDISESNNTELSNETQQAIKRKSLTN